MKSISPDIVRLLVAGVLLVLVFVAYSPALYNGFVWDDDFFVSNNSALRTRDGLKTIWLKPGALAQYYPLVFTTLWLEYRLWGEHPVGYHATNIMLHALNAVVLWQVLRWLRVPGAWMIAAVFALHPVHVESVAWISERKNVLSGLFYLLAVWSYLHACLSKESPTVAEPSASQPPVRPSSVFVWHVLTVACYLCALLSKTVTASLPVILGLVLWWKHQRLQRKDLVQLSGLLLIGAAFGLLTVVLEKQAGAEGEMWAFSFIDRCLIAGRALWFYVRKLLWPSPLMFSYPRWAIASGVWWQYLYPLAAVAVAVLCWWARKRLGKAPFVAVAYFGITLFPALGFFDVYPMQFSFVADHFQYLASIGMLALGIGVITVVVRRAHVRNRYVVGICATVLLILASRVQIECVKYENVEALWRDTITKNPDSWLAHYNLAAVLIPQGELEEAVEHYQEVIRIKPDYKLVYANLGLTLARQGRFEDAIPYYRQELEINPEYATYLHNNLGNALLALGRVEDAILHYRSALDIDSSHTESHNSLGVALAMAGDMRNAFHHYFEALRSKPGYKNAETNLVQALATPESVQECALLLQRYEVQGDRERLQFALSVIQSVSPESVPALLKRGTL